MDEKYIDYGFGCNKYIDFLHTKQDELPIQKIFFCVSIGLLGLSILVGSISLYGEINVMNKANQEYRARLLKQMSGEPREKGPIFVNPDKVYELSFLVCCVSLMLSVVSLIGYAISLELAH